MLQIEMIGWRVDLLSRSVTSGTVFDPWMLQIEMFGCRVERSS